MLLVNVMSNVTFVAEWMNTVNTVNTVKPVSPGE